MPSVSNGMSSGDFRTTNTTIFYFPVLKHWERNGVRPYGQDAERVNRNEDWILVRKKVEQEGFLIPSEKRTDATWGSPSPARCHIFEGSGICF